MTYEHNQSKEPFLPSTRPVIKKKPQICIKIVEISFTFFIAFGACLVPIHRVNTQSVQGNMVNSIRVKPANIVYIPSL